ncbi:MAG: Asp-tRNA(Asn)/Glu-tRNA(Gln) amidotransferase subunit GatC [Nitrospirae bacterium]|nr:Asp-tRNA(Asn)/Glu-tRNA(Gln) amidotransferase subunit GatC [Nitrospirota bacterium]
MEITRKEVEHVADLARLALREEEKTDLTRNLNDILTYMETLNRLDTSRIEPTAHAIPLKNVMRDDVSRPSLDRDRALANAPDRTDEFFRVPKVIE